jgi:hypothetical protein
MKIFKSSPYISAFVALVVLTSLASCSGGGGCGNCTVPAYNASAPTPLPPGVTPTPLPPGVTPTPLPPGVTPTPVPPAALSCAANATANGIPLGTDNNFAVLGGSTVTSAGPTIVTGDLGVSPGTAVTGFGPGTVVGTIHQADPVAAQAQLDLTVAYNAAAAKVNPTLLPADIGGKVIPPGTYNAPVSLAITGNVTLDGQNNPNAVFVFQIPSTLTASTTSSVTLINGANACNIFWQVGSSATINSGSIFNGNVLALASISLGTGTVVNGRVLARNGAVTMLSNIVTKTGP